MWRRCPDELLCDLAETYHITDPAALPLRRLAVLACGLGEDSRVFRALSGRQATTEQMMHAAILDRLSLLVWFQTEDGVKGNNRPESVLEKLTGKRQEERMMGYQTAADFEAARDRILKGGG